MQIIRHLNAKQLPLADSLALTIGNFDGLHLGHRQIITKLKEFAKNHDLKIAILTFEPHPAQFFNKKVKENFRLNSLAQKLRNFSEIGIDYAIVLPFNHDFSQISAENFVKEILLEKLNVRKLLVGHDFTFGKNRQGDFEFLQKFASKNFEISRIDAISQDKTVISSSKIRNLIRNGKITEANKFLGKNFVISGIISQGKKLASQLGFPTANIPNKSQIIQPKFGVYSSKVHLPYSEKSFTAITNFGVKPTIFGNQAPIYETHIFNFNEECYGQKIYVELLDFIRDEKKFASIDELKAQIEQDIKKVRNGKI